ncbi:MAG: LamG domain-containing protein, partial [Nanoarchaeota archaeon]
PLNINFIKTSPKTIYYLASPDAVYPGFGETIYQAKLVSGKLGNVEIQIENETEDFVFVEMPDEKMPCETEVIQEKNIIVNANSGTIILNKFSMRILPETFDSKEESVNLTIKELKPDCFIFEERYPRYISPPTKEDTDSAHSLYQDNTISKETYGNIKLTFDNQLECTKNEHCVGLRCTMGNLNCSYSCQEGECVISGSTGQRIVTLTKLTEHITKWINGEITLSVLKDKITLWITGGSEEESDDTNQDEATRPANKLETGLTAYYTFDNDTTTKVFDVSGRNNDGSITSNAGSVVYADGKLGKAVSFTGSGQISIPHNTDFNFGTGEFSLMGWIKMAELPNEQPRHIFGKRDTTGGGNWFRAFTNSFGKLLFEFTNGLSISTDLSYADEQWHFIALTRDSDGKAIFYLDNRSRQDTINFDVSNNAEFTIGKWSSENGFIGLIDEVRIYNKSLTQEEVLAIYNAEK